MAAAQRHQRIGSGMPLIAAAAASRMARMRLAYYVSHRNGMRRDICQVVAPTGMILSTTHISGVKQHENSASWRGAGNNKRISWQHRQQQRHGGIKRGGAAAAHKLAALAYRA